MTTPADPLVMAQDALSRGDFLAAYDVAISAHDAGEGSLRLSYIATLALARMGDTNLALELYERSGLAKIDDNDTRSLRGRLKKDLAEKAPAEERAALFAEASDAYRAVYEASGDYFPAINAATTALLAGNDESASKLASVVLEAPDVAKPTGYYATATAAEALILLDRPDEAFEAMKAAVRWSDAGVGSRASTFRQMTLIARTVPDRAEGIAPLIELLRPAPVLVYTGHMFVTDPAVEADIVARLEAALDKLQPDTAYGALACGADILVAECILRRGLELHVVLPFAKKDFIEQSVLPGGEGWLARFESCLERATRVSFATDMAYIGDPNLFRYGSAVAMGLARMRARHLRSDAVQLAVIQNGEGESVAGTASDVGMWQELGHQTEIVDPGTIDRDLAWPPVATMPEGVSRVAHSMIFADFAGFSQLNEAALPIFVDAVLGRTGALLDEFEDRILYRNSWGDALYAVIATPVDAAEIAIELQRRLSDIPQALRDCAEHCGMRIGVHHGPIYRGKDAVMKRDSFFGTEVTRTARIEPVTPTGEVYATEAFAAILSLDNDNRYGTHYVGKVELAKGYGDLAMYKLSRRSA